MRRWLNTGPGCPVGFQNLTGRGPGQPDLADLTLNHGLE